MKQKLSLIIYDYLNGSDIDLPLDEYDNEAALITDYIQTTKELSVAALGKRISEIFSDAFDQGYNENEFERLAAMLIDVIEDAKGIVDSRWQRAVKHDP